MEVSIAIIVVFFVHFLAKLTQSPIIIPTYVARGSDYVVPADTTAMFPVGSVNGSTACINLTIIDDDTLEGIETLIVSLAIVNDAGNNVNLGPSTTGTVTIEDNESKCYVTDA